MLRHPAIGEIWLFEAYLSDMEKFIEAENRRFRDRMAEISAGLVVTGEEDFDQALEKHLYGYTDSEWEYQNQQLQWDYEEQEGFLGINLEFLNILRKSFFVTLYGFLESRLITECRKLAIERGIDLSLLPKKRERSVDKAKEFFERVLHIQFETGSDWEEIQNLKMLRHCIVHNEGRLDEGFEDRDQSLKSYVQSNASLRLTRRNTIVFERGFCEEVIQTVRRYLMALFTRVSMLSHSGCG